MSGWGLFEEEKTDYVGLVLGWLSAAIAVTLEAPFMVFNIVAGLVVASSELVVDYTNQAVELAGFKEWWALEHTVVAVAFACMVPSLVRRNSGECNKAMLQLVASVKGLMWIATFFHLVQGLQGGVVFGGKLHYPTLFVLGLLLRGFNLNFLGTMQEIHGYGMDDGPSDVKTKKVIGMFDHGTFLESAIAYSIATFGLPDINCDGEDMRPWLVICPIIGFATLLNEWSKDSDGVAKVDVNGDAPAVAEEKKAEEPAAKADEPAKEAEKKKEEPKADEEKKDEEKKEEAKVSLITKACNLCKDCVGKVMCMACGAVCKVKSVAMCTVNKVMSLPWACIGDTVSHLGSNALVFMIFYHLTEDLLSLAFPLICVLLPVAMAKAQEKEWVSKASAHVVSEVAASSLYVVQYWLFSQHVAKPI